MFDFDCDDYDDDNCDCNDYDNDYDNIDESDVFDYDFDNNG